MGTRLSMKAHHWKLPNENLKSPKAARKFKEAVGREFNVKPERDRGTLKFYHWKVPIVDDIKVNIILYRSGTLDVSATPNLDKAKFEEFVKRIGRLATHAMTSISEERPLPVMRASKLLEYAKSLDLAKEEERMVAVIICDTANEIVLTTKMRSLEIKGEALNAGVPEKIKYIEGKGEQVYKKRQVEQIRYLRNEVAHAGNIPTEKQAKKVVVWSNDFLKNA